MMMIVQDLAIVSSHFAVVSDVKTTRVININTNIQDSALPIKCFEIRNSSIEI
jgi:hypothetical protein